MIHLLFNYSQLCITLLQLASCSTFNITILSTSSNTVASSTIMWNLKSTNFRQWNITLSLNYGDTDTFQAALVAVISNMIMDHEFEKMRKATSRFLRYNTNMGRLIKQPEHLGQYNVARLRYECGTSSTQRRTIKNFRRHVVKWQSCHNLLL